MESVDSDAIVCTPLKARKRSCVDNDRDCEQICLECNAEWPIDLSKPLHELFSFPLTARIIGGHRLTPREVKVFYVLFTVKKLHLKHPPHAQLVVPVNDSVTRCFFRHSRCPTIDPSSRLWLLDRTTYPHLLLRPLLVREIWRLQNKPLEELLPAREYGALYETYKEKDLRNLCGQAYHQASQFAFHWVCSEPAVQSGLETGPV